MGTKHSNVAAGPRRLLLCDYELKLQHGAVQAAAGMSVLTGLLADLRDLGIALTVPKAAITAENKVVPDLEQEMLKELDRSTAALVVSVPGFFDFESVAKRLRERVEEGLAVWVMAPPRSSVTGALPYQDRAKRYTHFLASVGVELTDIGLFDEATSFDHPRSFALERATYPAGFRSPQLFHGVERLVFQQAHALRLHGDAQAVAAVDPRRFDVVDMKTDFFFEWNEPDFAVMSITYVGSSGGYVLVSSGLVVADAYVGPMGHRFPGHTENTVFFRNLGKGLTVRGTGTLTDEQEVHRLIQTIERTLLETIQVVLGADWPSFIDPKARERAEEKRDQEQTGIEWPAYLDLSNHINTLVKNREKFAPLLERCGFPTSKNKLKSDVLRTGELIRLRILDAHVTKRVLTSHEFAPSDLQALEEVLSNCVKLWRTATELKTT